MPGTAPATSLRCYTVMPTEGDQPTPTVLVKAGGATGVVTLFVVRETVKPAGPHERNVNCGG